MWGKGCIHGSFPYVRPLLVILSIDFETRSTLDLRKTGVYPYAAHPTTDIWCMAYAFGDEEPALWVPPRPALGGAPHPSARVEGGEMTWFGPVPPSILEHIESGGELRAWNAQFERIIWREIMVKRYGFPPIRDEQWVDTAAEAAALALPRSLDQAARVLGLDVEKDMAGRRLMLQMAKPRKIRGSDELVWWDDEERRLKLYEYCRQDVRVERAVKERLKPLSPMEREVYLLDQRINDRGVRIDLPLVNAAQELVTIVTEQGNAELEQITGGAVSAVTKVADIKSWLAGKGLELDSLSKDIVRDLLAKPDDLSTDVERVLQIRADLGKSSTAKLVAMVRATCEDSRARGLFLYHAASTGRWGGKLIQPQNFPRPLIKWIDRYIPWVMDREFELIEFEHPPAVVVSSMLRSMMIASPGHRLIAGDFGQIEARVLAWIAGQTDLLQLFASGGKVYETMASYIFSKDVELISEDSFERQIGKNSELGFGFQMGEDRFAEQVREQTGIVLDRDRTWNCSPCEKKGVQPSAEIRKWHVDDKPEEETCVRCGRPMKVVQGPNDLALRAKTTYRERRNKVVLFWADINNAALSAVMDPGTVYAVGRNDAIKYVVRGQFLWCRLPSGRFLAYAMPDIRDKRLPEPYEHVTKPSVTYMGVDSKTRKWRRHYTYGGHLTENVVQAMARDLMASAMLRIEAAGYGAPVLTAHDEIVGDVPEDFGSLDEFLKLMKTRPKWAAGLPVKAGGWVGERYRK